MKTSVSILICAFNAEKFIAKTLISVIKQDFVDFEILIIDNNSSDGTKTIIEEFIQKDSRIKLFGSKTNLGAFGGLNFLLERANGKYIAILDHDDCWHKNKINEQVIFLDHYNNYEGCGVKPIIYYEGYNKFSIDKTSEGKVDTVFHTGLLFRNRGYRYDLSHKTHTDVFFMREVLKSIFLLDRNYLLYRVRKDSNNLSIIWGKNFKQTLFMYKKGYTNLASIFYVLYVSFFPNISRSLSISLFSKNKYINQIDLSPEYTWVTNYL